MSGLIIFNKANPNEELMVFELEGAEAYPMTTKARFKAGVKNSDLSQDDLEILDEIEKEKREEKEVREKLKEEGKDPGPLKQYVFLS